MTGKQVDTMTQTKPCGRVLAPISGKTIDITTVHDPVFAEKMTGDGLAIQAEDDTVIAPCDGRITLFFDTRHAFAITTDSGIQILVHIGLDTVLMNGEGITALHRCGEYVHAGAPILKLDLPLLKKRKINLVSPVIIVNYEQVHNLTPLPAGRQVTTGQDIVLTYSL